MTKGDRYSLFKLWDVDLKGVFYGEGVANSFLRILRLVMAEEEIGALEVEALLSSLIRQVSLLLLLLLGGNLLTQP